MKISTKGRYALRFLLDLAENYGGDYISMRDISHRQCISRKYLEQIVPLLSRAGLLLANRGLQGGYKLAKEPAEYTVGEVLRLTEGSLAPVACLEDDTSCEREADCATLPMWKGLQKVINEYLDSITLEDLMKQGTHCHKALEE